MTACPNCHGVARVTETRQLATGQKRRRFRCKSCDYRWSEWSGPTSGLSCHSCRHWTARRCDLGFPDPMQDGPQFAAMCGWYQEEA